jgi:hypothetical protein
MRTKRLDIFYRAFTRRLLFDLFIIYSHHLIDRLSAKNTLER